MKKYTKTRIREIIAISLSLTTLATAQTEPPRPPDERQMIDQFGDSLTMSPTGALSVNIDYENGTRENYYIEQQRYGADVIEVGFLLADTSLINDGIAMINWGFSKQGPDGSFPGTGDAVHSSSLFMEAAARAALKLEAEDATLYAATLNDWRPKLVNLATWFVTADDYGQDVNLEPFAHRYFLRGAALSQTALFTGNTSFLAPAYVYANGGAASAWADGTFPEREGFDGSYQLVGMAFALRLYGTITDTQVRTTLDSAVQAGVTLFMNKLAVEGEDLLYGGSRTANETGRTGRPKNFDFKHATQALVGAEEVLGMTGGIAAANQVMGYKEN
ncbi:hypothetical protein [Roseibacillus ishigakijimensis]|uniref:Uncharacterized protein n=1 Tax=Roseibacillus ishigakijimensis TaxID=454146 RepID=A0A934VJG6_9BACT|nr:hypothetical protein [Roseibacillus ishigakijimensis]MBK1832579.1 hypothetical protein [Roseibacillus ishigakijimensis]